MRIWMWNTSVSLCLNFASAGKYTTDFHTDSLANCTNIMISTQSASDILLIWSTQAPSEQNCLSQCVWQAGFITVWNSLIRTQKKNQNFAERVRAYITYCGIICVSLQCLLCTKWQTTDGPSSTPKTNLEHRGSQRETERNVSSIPAGLNSVLDFCLSPRCSLQLSDVSYTPNLHSVLKNYP